MPFLAFAGPPGPKWASASAINLFGILSVLKHEIDAQLEAGKMTLTRGADPREHVAERVPTSILRAARRGRSIYKQLVVASVADMLV